jgi:hypothetical protein
MEKKNQFLLPKRKNFDKSYCHAFLLLEEMTTVGGGVDAGWKKHNLHEAIASDIQKIVDSPGGMCEDTQKVMKWLFSPPLHLVIKVLQGLVEHQQINMLLNTVIQQNHKR